MTPIHPQIRARDKRTPIPQQEHHRPPHLIHFTQPAQHILPRPLLLPSGLLKRNLCRRGADVAW